jgi:nitrogen-specific signal transduction histidine kinase/ActR/RegA family two-component response regulator
VGIIEYARDISNQKLMEKEMQKVEKLESLGILAGGIAHDFNNILTAILGNVSLAKMPGRCDEKIIKRLTDAEKACERAKDLTQQLLTFAKGGTPIKKTAAIAELIRDTAGFALRGSNVRSEVSIAEDLWAVDVDEGQISQVIHNLVINADQAMPQGGVLKLRAENMRIDANKVIPLPEGNYIAIAIVDQGVGIPKEYVAKIFDPFFTTKQKGSGLGLASSYSIISNHGGHITVESTPGSGSTFTFYLPASDKKIESKKPAIQRVRSGTGKILIMDDEDLIRDVARDILKSLGYETDLARDGAEALDLYRKAKNAGKPYAAVIMDLTIPGGMGGEEAVKKLHAIDPDAKAIVSSGYSTGPIMSDFKAYGFSGVITKPYRIADMGATLQLVINSKSA